MHGIWLRLLLVVSLGLVACSAPTNPDMPGDGGAPEVDLVEEPEVTPDDAPVQGDAPEDLTFPRDVADARDIGGEAGTADLPEASADVREAGSDAPGDARESGADATLDATLDAAADAPLDRGAPSDVVLPEGGRACVSSGDCDDGIDCTIDRCAAGVCSRAPDDRSCPSGQRCAPGIGCVAGRACARAADCDDDDPCTINPRCDAASRRCQYDLLDDDFDYEPRAACGGFDCDDGTSRVAPGAREVCDGVDNNCNGLVDEEGLSPACRGGSCVDGRCSCLASGLTLCGTTCLDLATDRDNCGRCGNSCGVGGRCAAGGCVCDVGEASCAGRCVDLAADRVHCGACGTVCPNATVCRLGACVCPPEIGRVSCSGACVDLQTHREHCGACGTACRDDQLCQAGRCVCDVGATLCAGRCVALADDVRNCGSCGVACPAPLVGGVCVAGRCGCRAGILCGTGAAARCVDTSRDVDHCGACGAACSGGRECVAGRCACAAGATLCADRCVDLASDPMNCGACGRTCPAPPGSVAACVAGACAAACAAGRGDCDRAAANGCEVDLRSDRSHCGACGAACAGGAACAFGACAGAEWARSFGATVINETYAVAASAAGDIYAAGYFLGSMTFGGVTVTSAGRSDAYLAALDPSGSPRWIRRIGGANDDVCGDVAVDAAGNVYVAGTVTDAADLGGGSVAGTGGSIFVSSFTSSGTFRWARRYGGGPANYLSDVATDAGGNVYLTGRFAGTVDFGAGPLRSSAMSNGWGYVVSLTGAGRLRWALPIEGDPIGVGQIAFGPDGNGAIVFSFLRGASVGGLWVRSGNGIDAAVAGLTVDGSVRWVRTWGGREEDFATEVALNARGDVYVSGPFASPSMTVGAFTLTNAEPRGTAIDQSLIILTAAGVPRAARRYGGALDEDSEHLLVDGSGNVHLAGTFSGSADFGSVTLSSTDSEDGFLLLLDGEGVTRRARQIGGSGPDSIKGLALVGADLVCAGTFTGGIRVGRTPLVGRGTRDGFVARMVP